MKLTLPTAKTLVAGALCLASFTASAQQYATSVVSVSPGTANNPTGVAAPLRAITTNALGAPQNSDAVVPDANFNAYSMGFGGSIVLGFSEPFGRGAGADVSIVETTFGNKSCTSYPEQVKVYFSQTGAEGSWVYGGEGCQNFSLELPANLAWAQYVKLVDFSPADAPDFANIGDGYDLDGISALYTATACPPVAGSCATGMMSKVVSFSKGKRKDNCAVASSRQNPAEALGMPNGEICGPINFVSLGFGGCAVYEFCYTQFDRPGADLNVFETSWGDCWSFFDFLYPEQAEFWGSNDGTTWTLLKSLDRTPCLPAGRIIRDGQLDLCTMPLVNGLRTLRFIKVIDKTDRYNCFFPYYADGYDLDAIVSTSCNTNCRIGEVYEPTPEDKAMAAAMLGNSLNVAPNPVAYGSVVDVNFTVEKAGSVNVELLDMSGKLVRTIQNSDIEAGPHTVQLFTSGLRAGMYIVRMSGDDAAMTQTVRMMVQ